MFKNNALDSYKECERNLQEVPTTDIYKKFQRYPFQVYNTLIIMLSDENFDK